MKKYSIRYEQAERSYDFQIYLSNELKSSLALLIELLYNKMIK